MEAYFDNAATTRPLRGVREIMIKTLADDYGNPSSKHTKGMDAEQYISDARSVIAKTLKCEPKNIIFTSGGTEANNQALIGTAFAEKRKGKHIITTVFEHASVHNPLIFLEGMGYEVTYVPVDKGGNIDADKIISAIRPDTILISVMVVNNEIGSVIDIESIAEEVKKIRPDIIGG